MRTESITCVAVHSRKGGVLSSLNEGKFKVMAKKKNSRKALAVALGIMGIAGLSVASASSLNLTAGDEVGIGVDTFANCQDTDLITVDYNYDSTSMKVTGVTFDGIVAGCEGHDLTFTLDYLSDATPPVAGALEPAAYTLTAGDVGTNTYTYAIVAGDQFPVSYELGDVTVIIK